MGVGVARQDLGFVCLGLLAICVRGERERLRSERLGPGSDRVLMFIYIAL